MDLNFNKITFSQLTVDFVKDYLKIDYNDDDNELQLYLVAAQSFVFNQLNVDLEVIDSKPDIIIVTLMIISHFYENKAITISGTRTNNQQLDFIFEQIMLQYREWF